jgi:acetyl-CoA carboxylase biotin carboxylase subunit
MRPLACVAIANRGEIALRIQRACRLLGIEAVQLHSEADRDSSFVRLASRSLCIGPAAAAASYLNQVAVLTAARLVGADAIHPGYGFLSENAEFAAAVEATGLTFIGPTSAAIRLMGDKIQAKRAMLAAGVPCVPGVEDALSDSAAEAAGIARRIGLPIIIKAASGGGGGGMRVVREEAELAAAVAATKEAAARAFGNPAVYMEKFLETPRHIEIQVLADAYGNAVWAGDRDCSMQRRHQKVIEEAPAPLVGRTLVAAIGERCAEACRRIGYRGAGTFEFLYEAGQFYFIEMNTRIQVEHPVTEMVTGLDLVAAQLRIAGGEALWFSQADLEVRGHAIECRINAEDPATFQPSPGRITAWHAPGGPGVRVDSHACAGYSVPPHYDSLIGKVIAHGASRAEAVARMRAALAEIVIEGIKTNIPLHRMLLEDAGFIAGGSSIHYLEQRPAGHHG